MNTAIQHTLPSSVAIANAIGIAIEQFDVTSIDSDSDPDSDSESDMRASMLIGHGDGDGQRADGVP